MADRGKMALEARGEIAGLDLHVIEIELHPHIRPRDLLDDRRRLLRQMQQIFRPVAPVERLDQEADAVLGGEIGGAGEIGDERAFGRALLGFRRHPAGEAVDGLRADADRIVERPGEQRGELLLRARAPPRRRPGRRTHPGVDAEHGQAVPLDLAADVGRLLVIRGLQLDGLEARAGGGAEPREQRAFGEEIGEIRGKTGHGPLFKRFAERTGSGAQRLKR